MGGTRRMGLGLKNDFARYIYRLIYHSHQMDRSHLFNLVKISATYRKGGDHTLSPTSTWSRQTHEKFGGSVNELFSTLFLAIQRLEQETTLPLAHQAMFEEMLTLWTNKDSKYHLDMSDHPFARYMENGHFNIVNYLTDQQTAK